MLMICTPPGCLAGSVLHLVEKHESARDSFDRLEIEMPLAARGQSKTAPKQ